MRTLGDCGRDRRRTAAWLLPLAACAGCGGPAEPTYPCTNLGGHVTLDGARVVDGVVAFSSQDARLGRIVVTTIVRGRYIAEKVPLGKVLAVVSAYKLGVPGRSIEAEALALARADPAATSVTKTNLVPQRYRYGFELDVGPRSSDVDFAMLTSGPAAAATTPPEPAAVAGPEPPARPEPPAAAPATPAPAGDPGAAPAAAPTPADAPDAAGAAPRFGVEAGAGSDYNESNLPPR
jgi:hypothetical protein